MPFPPNFPALILVQAYSCHHQASLLDAACTPSPQQHRALLLPLLGPPVFPVLTPPEAHGLGGLLWGCLAFPALWKDMDGTDSLPPAAPCPLGPSHVRGELREGVASTAAHAQQECVAQGLAQGAADAADVAQGVHEQD